MKQNQESSKNNKIQVIQEIMQKKLNHKKKADDYSANYQYENAINEYKKLIMMEPENLLYYVDLANIYRTIGDTNYSIQLLQKASMLEAENAKLQEQIHQQAVRQGFMVANARDELIIEPKNKDEEEIKNMEKQQFILFSNSTIMRDMGYYQYALKEINKCLENNPNEFQAILFKANLLKIFGMFEECAQVVQKALTINKNHPKVQRLMHFFQPKSDDYLQQSKQMILKQEFQKSLYFIQKGLLFNPQNLKLILLKAFVNRSQKNYEQSLIDLEQAYKICQNQQEIQDVRLQIAHTYNEMAKLLFSLGRSQEAIQIFSEALNFKNLDWGILINRGDCYSALKDYEKALKDYKQAKEQTSCDQEQVNSRISVVQTYQGIELFNQQKYDKSIKLFTDAIISDQKKNSQAYSKRGISFIKLGKVAEAQSDFKKALQIDAKNQDALNYFSNTNFKPS